MDSYKKPDEEMSSEEKRNFILRQARILDEWTSKGKQFLEYSATALGPLDGKITDNIVGYLRMLKDCVNNHERLSTRLKTDFNADVNDAPSNVTLITAAKKPVNKPFVYNERLGKHVRPIELD